MMSLFVALSLAAILSTAGQLVLDNELLLLLHHLSF